MDEYQPNFGHFFKGMRIGGIFGIEKKGYIMKRVKRVDKSDKREYINKYRREWMDNERDESGDERSVIEMILK